MPHKKYIFAESAVLSYKNNFGIRKEYGFEGFSTNDWNDIDAKNQTQYFEQFSELFGSEAKFKQMNDIVIDPGDIEFNLTTGGKRRIRKLKSVKKYHKSKGLKGKSRRRRRTTRKDKIKKRK